ncbi:alpha-galactosidase A [Kalymmatonema gypsitolerans NIES-4073]|nr:alpha-galactosidase A [Scytonema sp. NIES-4073]
MRYFLNVKSFLLILTFLVFSLFQPECWALDNGLASTPPMGWNSWNKFGCEKINEKLIRETADAMVSSGMRDAGYQYLVIDDCWQIARDKSGNIIADHKKFPSGMKALADYIHSKGLKFGLYSTAGTKTCQGRPASWGYEFQDARQYAAWEVDYLKYDWCNNGQQNSVAAYSIMRDALKQAGRPIVYSICEWGSTKPWLWAKDVGHLWRTTGDIIDCWDCKQDWGGIGVMRILDQQVGLESFAGPGHWNDPDMLQVGNGALSPSEYQAHFSLWSILSAPLMAGNDLRNMKPEITQILTNKEVIAINQDALGIQGRKVRDEGEFEVWAKPLVDGTRAVVLLNRSNAQANISVSWTEIGYPTNLTFVVQDLWQKKNLGKYKGLFTAKVPSHAVVMVKIKS